MNKQEFIQEAALRLITALPNEPAVNIYAIAVDLAGYVYPEDKKHEPEIITGFPADEPIDNLLKEIDRMDEESARQRNEEAKKEGRTGYHHQKGGYAEAVRRKCIRLGFKRVSSLVNYGRASFRSERNIGEKCVDAIDKALLNLYNIKTW